MIGSRRDYMPQLNRRTQEVLTLPQVPDIPIKDRLYLYTVRSRRVLAKYVGMEKATLGPKQNLSHTEFSNIVQDISSCQPTLATLLLKYGRECPDDVRIFLGQLATGSATCTILPIAGNNSNQTRQNILKVANESVNLNDPYNAEIYEDIANNAPLILQFLTHSVFNSIDVNVLVQEIIHSILQPSQQSFLGLW